MVVFTRGMSMLHADVSKPLCYLTGNSTNFHAYSWTVRHNSKVYGIVEIVLINVQQDPKTFLDFEETLRMLKPFREHLKYMREVKIDRHYRDLNSISKVIPHNLLIDYLFDPQY